MASTPEGRVKSKITHILKQAESCYYFMPVQTGYGSPTLDYLGCCNGVAFAIEAKAPGKKPTKRQEAIIKGMKTCGMKVFVIDGLPADFENLRLWLWAITHG